MAKKIAMYSVFASLAIIAGYIEFLIPAPVPIPGVKLGIANVVVLFTMYFMNARAALSITLIRIILSAFLFSGFGALMYSIAGGLLSFLVMYIAKWLKVFGMIGVSVLGGVFHNIGQVIVAIFIVSNPQLVFTLPVLFISGVITGILIGIVSNYMLLYMKKARIKY